jgi:hypothetical protein
MTRTTRRIATVLILITVSLLTCEAVLAVADPLGFWRYYNDMRALRQHLWPHAERHYVPVPGIWQMTGWTYRIDLPDYTRHTPASRPGADCTVVALGDSVTFGWGVDDAEAWPNLYAEMTGCEVVNTAQVGYDIWAVYAAYKAFPDADRYIYLLVYDDAGRGDEMQLTPLDGAGALGLYLYLLRAQRETVGPVEIPDDFWTAYDALAVDERVTIYGFRDGGLAEQVAATGRAIRLAAPYRTRISWADAHPDADAQRGIAESIAGGDDGNE